MKQGKVITGDDMQKIMYVSDEWGTKNCNDNQYIIAINELLSDGWKIVEIVCSNRGGEGSFGVGGFVVLEKEEQ